jgi:Rha family phage regulatory protein
MNQIQSITPVVSIINQTAITTSIDVARVFEKRHDHIIRTIEQLREDCGVEYLPNFGEASYEAEQPNGGKATYKCYNLTRDGFTLLAMGFTGKKALQFKLGYIGQFNAMESALQQQAQSTQNRLSDKADRVPLKDAVNLLVAKAKNLNYSEAYTMVHQRFNIESVDELTAEQLPDVVEYVHRMIGSWEHAPVALPTPAPQIDPSQLTVHRNHVLHIYQTARQLVREIDMLGMAQDDLPKYLLA